MKLPVLFIIANNARWAAVHRSTLAPIRRARLAESKQPPFRDARALAALRARHPGFGGHGERVSEPKELMPALERALKVVKEEKRQALVNVCLEVSYVKTS
jgi:acetolactate synthase-1/2/3 large subunit